jgi:hypothetical protein
MTDRGPAIRQRYRLRCATHERRLSPGFDAKGQNRLDVVREIEITEALDILQSLRSKKRKELLRRSNAGSNRVSILLAGDALNVGEIEMNADPRRESGRGPYHPDERVRRHQEEALDDAFKHTFPA